MAPGQRDERAGRGAHAAERRPSLGHGAHTVLHETTTMALYLAISMLALLSALPHGEDGVTHTVAGTVWSGGRSRG